MAATIKLRNRRCVGAILGSVTLLTGCSCDQHGLALGPVTAQHMLAVAGQGDGSQDADYCYDYHHLDQGKASGQLHCYGTHSAISHGMVCQLWRPCRSGAVARPTD